MSRLQNSLPIIWSLIALIMLVLTLAIALPLTKEHAAVVCKIGALVFSMMGIIITLYPMFKSAEKDDSLLGQLVNFENVITAPTLKPIEGNANIQLGEVTSSSSATVGEHPDSTAAIKRMIAENKAEIGTHSKLLAGLEKQFEIVINPQLNKAALQREGDRKVSKENYRWVIAGNFYVVLAISLASYTDLFLSK